jgi:hypothetical protein
MACRLQAVFAVGSDSVCGASGCLAGFCVMRAEAQPASSTFGTNKDKDRQ